jgi:hypothetical protein
MNLLATAAIILIAAVYLTGVVASLVESADRSMHHFAALSGPKAAAVRIVMALGWPAYLTWDAVRHFWR